MIGVGANSVDFVNLLPGYPQPFGSFAKMQIRERRVLCGGQTATAMCTCASLGLRSKYVGVSGTDENGRRIRRKDSRRNVDVTDPTIIRDAENQFARSFSSTEKQPASASERSPCACAIRVAEFCGRARDSVDDVDEDAAIRLAFAAGCGLAPSSRAISIALPRTGSSSAP